MQEAQEQKQEITTNLLGRSLALAAFIAIVGVILLTFGLVDKTKNVVSYNEGGSNIEYDVHLLPNDVYENGYITGSSDRSYPTSLIDYLDLQYKYSAAFSVPVSGVLHYKLVALTSADKVEGNVDAHLWEEEVELLPEQSASISGNSLALNQDVKIDYAKYLEKIKRFSSAAEGVIAKGKLNVAMIIEGDVKPAGFSEATQFSSRLDFTIAIDENSSVEGKIKEIKKDDIVLKEETVGTDLVHRISVLSGIALLFLTAIILLVWLVVRMHHAAKYPYETHVRKILDDYGGVIVEMRSAPNIMSESVSDVSDFDELLDVYNSTHAPINLYCDANASYFFIIGEKNAWRYVIRRSDFE